MNYIKNVLKRISILLLVASILLTIYLVICPVRTLGEVLEKKEIDIFTDSYERKDYETICIFPISWSGLKNDVLGIKEKSPSENNFYFSSPDDKDELCKLLSSLKVRKKLGEYQSHPDEDSYEYWIHFFWNQNLDIMLCQKELCFETSPAIRYGSSKFNAYYIVNCPENEEILKKILELLLNKMKL
ncbi:hypothetical protein [Negativibacillus massiliensis]|uniref:hypothetical protein n=1 Tax=Negativibacillus massiliensis TaxID=1871035 RepID=UPI003AF9D4C5